MMASIREPGSDIPWHRADKCGFFRGRHTARQIAEFLDCSPEAVMMHCVRYGKKYKRVRGVHHD